MRKLAHAALCAAAAGACAAPLDPIEDGLAVEVPERYASAREGAFDEVLFFDLAEVGRHVVGLRGALGFYPSLGHLFRPRLPQTQYPYPKGLRVTVAANFHPSPRADRPR